MEKIDLIPESEKSYDEPVSFSDIANNEVVLGYMDISEVDCGNKVQNIAHELTTSMVSRPRRILRTAGIYFDGSIAKWTLNMEVDN